MNTSNLQFIQSETGLFTFDTGILNGVLRHEGTSNGFVPVTYTVDSFDIIGGKMSHDILLANWLLRSYFLT